MMDQQSNANILNQSLSNILMLLNRPFDHKYMIDGWNEGTRIKWQNLFVDIQRNLLSGKELPIASIARSMDFDGIISGEILEKAAEISNLIRSLNNENLQPGHANYGSKLD